MYDVKIKKTYSADFEKIFPLLQEFQSPYTKEDWQRIFNYKWEGIEDYVGFHLEHEGQIVGFMGLIFSIRKKQNIQHKFCNITSLIVKEKYRASTILLIRKLQKIPDIIFTGLRPIEESYRLLTLLGFSAYETNYKIIPTANCWLSKSYRVNVYETPDLLDKISNEERRIAIDHMELKCKSLLFDFDGKTCLLIYKITTQTYSKIPFKKIHILYISDVPFFNKMLISILRVFNLRLGFWSAIYIDKRFLQKSFSFFYFIKKIAPPRISNAVNKHQIDFDELYSEAVLL